MAPSFEIRTPVALLPRNKETALSYTSSLTINTPPDRTVTVILQSVRVQNYQSIIDSGTVDIEPDITALVGMTGAGKTSFLEMIAGLDPARVFYETELPNESVTKQKFQNGELRASDILQLTATFRVQEADNAVVPEQFRGVDIIEVNRYFDGHFEIKTTKGSVKQGAIDTQPFVARINGILQSTKTNLANAEPRLPNLRQQEAAFFKAIDDFSQTNLTNLKEFDLSLQSIRNTINVTQKDGPLQNEFNQRLAELQAVRTDLGSALEQDPVKKLMDAIPRPVYKRDVFELADSVPVDEFINKPESSRTFQCIAIISGLKPSGVQTIRNARPADQDAYLRVISKSLSDQLNSFWSQEQYDFAVNIRDNRLVLSVADRTTRKITSVLDGSDGFKWFTAFFLEMSADQSQKTAGSVVLLDNPATSLHDEGKADVLRFLNRSAESGKIQILYATHERPLIDPWRIDRVRAVEKGKDGTKLDRLKGDSRPDLLQRVRRNIGSPAKYSLFGAPRTVAFEGISDMNMVSAFNEYLERQGSSHLHKDLFSINGIDGIGNAPNSCQVFKTLGIDFVIVVDSGQKTQDMKQHVPRDDYKHFVEIKEVIGREGDTEDLVDPDLYYSAFKAAYEDLLDELPTLEELESHGKNKKVVNKYDDWFRREEKDFDKTLVSQQMFKLLMFNATHDDSIKQSVSNSAANFARLFELVAKKFSE